MDMNLTDERKLLKETVSNFCKSEFESEKLRHMTETEPLGLPRALWGRIAEQGWLGVLASEDDGGLGLGAIDLGIIAEEMGRRVAPGPFLSTAALAVPAIAIGGTAETRANLLPALISGEKIGTFALLEADPTVCTRSVHATATKSGDGWTLNGTKEFVGDAPSADVFVVVARTGAAGTGEVSLFVVERGGAGVEVQANKLTDMGSRSGRLVLKDAKVPASALVGEVDGGSAIVMELLKIANVCIAGAAIAGAERIFEITLNYVKERRQFGVPVGSFQAVKHPLAALYTELELARSAYHYAAWAVQEKTADSLAAMGVARLTCCNAYVRATQDCLQAHGGIGFTWEHDLHLFLKRARHYQYLLGEPKEYEELVAKEALKI